ncbi:hypothetical protein TSMEX_011709 [Taenia solium]|eukprot:TsM_000442800 transcript=TsM_000442800 gene=TsM_000442800
MCPGMAPLFDYKQLGYEISDAAGRHFGSSGWALVSVSSFSWVSRVQSAGICSPARSLAVPFKAPSSLSLWIRVDFLISVRLVGRRSG